MIITVNDRAKLGISEITLEKINKISSYLYIDTEVKYFGHSHGFTLSDQKRCYDERHIHLYRYKVNGGLRMNFSTITLTPENINEKRLLYRTFLEDCQRYCIGFVLFDYAEWLEKPSNFEVIWNVNSQTITNGRNKAR